MSLKEAARQMSEVHGFDATLRQWERRIAPEKWGFSKYASRDERLKAIDASGKSLLDVSQRGRRKSTASDGRPSLTEDRNLRRFARREVSRESRESRRPRARSVSVFSDQSDQDMDDASSAAPSPAPSDHIMNLQDLSSFSQQDFPSFQNPWAAESSQDSAMAIPQIHIFDESQTLAIPQINVCGPDEAYITPNHIPMGMQAQVNVHIPIEHNHDAFDSFHDNVSNQFNDVQLQSQTFITGDMATQLETNIEWNEPLLAHQRQSSGLASFAFDNNNPMSYTEMLQLDSQDLQNAMASTKNQDHLGNGRSRHNEGSDESIADYEFSPDFEDPTYNDLFAVLKERDHKVMQMIIMLKQSCQNSTGSEYAQSHIINSIALLEQGIQAQSESGSSQSTSLLIEPQTQNRRAT